MEITTREETAMPIATMPARWFTETTGRDIRLIVIHDMEAPELDGTAEAVARFFANLPATRKASAHECVDTNSVVRCVRDKDVAFAAPGANHDGWQLELAGFARQTRRQWGDAESRKILTLGAKRVARKCDRYDIPVRFVDAADLVAGGDRRHGVTTHAEVTKAFHLSTHTDPGAGFPMDAFLAQVKGFLAPHTYVVKPGDTIESVAKAHGLTVGDFWRLNRARLVPGDDVRVR